MGLQPGTDTGSIDVTLGQDNNRHSVIPVIRMIFFFYLGPRVRLPFLFEYYSAIEIGLCPLSHQGVPDFLGQMVNILVMLEEFVIFCMRQ